MEEQEPVQSGKVVGKVQKEQNSQPVSIDADTILVGLRSTSLRLKEAQYSPLPQFPAGIEDTSLGYLTVPLQESNTRNDRSMWILPQYQYALNTMKVSGNNDIQTQDIICLTDSSQI